MKVRNMTQGSILKNLIAFSVPVIVGNLLQEAYNVVDTLIVGQTLGVEKLAAIGATGPLNMLAGGLIMGLTAGCSVLTSQHYGADRTEQIKQSMAAHIVIAVVLAVVMTIGFSIGTIPMLRLLNTTSDTFHDACSYLRIIYLGIPAMLLYNLLASSLRAVGDSRTPLLLLICSSLLNIVLDFAFILGLKWDVAGAAIATVLAQTISGLLCLIYTIRRVPLLLPDRSSWQSLFRMVWEELKVGIPMGFQFVIIAGGMMVLQSVLNGFGSDAVAAYSVGGKIQGLCQNPFGSMGTVVATFVGQNAGAKQYDRIRSGVKKSLIFTVLLAVAIGGAVWVLARPITLLFVSAEETAVIAQTGEYLSWGCPLLWTLSFLFVCRGALQGLGDGVMPMLGGVLELCMRAIIPLTLGGTLGFTAICIAGPAAWTACGLLMTVAFFIRLHKSRQA